LRPMDLDLDLGLPLWDLTTSLSSSILEHVKGRLVAVCAFYEINKLQKDIARIYII